MIDKKESLISRILKKFFKKKDVEQTKIEIIEVSEDKMKEIYQAYYDKQEMTETKEKLDRINNELWLTDQGG